MAYPNTTKQNIPLGHPLLTPMERVDGKVDFSLNMPGFRRSGGFGASEPLLSLDGVLPHVYTSVLGGGERSKILIRGVTGFTGITCTEEARFFSYILKLPVRTNLSESYVKKW